VFLLTINKRVFVQKKKQNKRKWNKATKAPSIPSMSRYFEILLALKACEAAILDLG
jgi:hypothetical protein